jgi:hypothetical protein
MFKLEESIAVFLFLQAVIYSSSSSWSAFKSVNTLCSGAVRSLPISAEEAAEHGGIQTSV